MTFTQNAVDALHRLADVMLKGLHAIQDNPQPAKDALHALLRHPLFLLVVTILLLNMSYRRLSPYHECMSIERERIKVGNAEDIAAGYDIDAYESLGRQRRAQERCAEANSW